MFIFKSPSSSAEKSTSRTAIAKSARGVRITPRAIRLRFGLPAVALSLFFAGLPLSYAADVPIETLRGKDPEGFQRIFNGKNFEGWAGPIDNYEVRDGAIVCKPGKGGTIYTTQTYSDFIVRFEFNLPPGGNNGLAIRYPGKGNTAYDGMCELQVLDDNYEKARNTTIDARQAHGSAYGMVPARRGFQRPPGQWNYEQVTVVGSKIKVELNGTVILDCDLANVKEFMGGSPHPGKDRTEGHFGFAGHSDPVMFRNIAIKKLK